MKNGFQRVPEETTAPCPTVIKKDLFSVWHPWEGS